jgi:signal transduction histidine kinase
VWNEGSAIPQTERDRIFERFYRGAAARKLTGGSGLGLFVARKIALAHSGDLALANGPQGVGFRLTFPAMSAEAFANDEQ